MSLKLVIPIVAFLAHCAALAHGPAGPAQSDLQPCREFYRTVDQTVAAAKVQDVQASRVAGFPYLRVDRFFQSFRTEVESPEKFNAWLDHLQDLDLEARAHELARLPGDRVEALRKAVPADIGEHDGASANLRQALHECAHKLRAADTADLHTVERLRKAAQVRENYRLWTRLLGLYPVTAIPFSAGIRKYQRETLATFQRPLTELPVNGTLTQFSPPAVPDDGAEIGPILQRSRDNPLAVAKPNSNDLERLFARFAPVFEIDVANGDDRLGRLSWDDKGALTVDTTSPTIHRLVSHTQVDRRSLLQLNYVAWFPRRPKRGSTDLLAGEIDSIIWRVTLSEDGKPLMYDSIHSCGCYHMFFPSIRLTARPPAPNLSEQAFVPQTAPELLPGERMVVRVSAVSHYLQRVYAASGTGPTTVVSYQFAEYDELRSLVGVDGVRRGVFGPNGLIAGSERGERFLFWPMGIVSAGAMRQWGHHATAFVGKRHFDDSDLITRSFTVSP